MLSRNQERFLQSLLLGKKIVEAAKEAGITERTAYNWLKDPEIQSERAAREKALAEAEQAEITRILTSGYALMHKRVEALNALSQKLEAYLADENKVWLPDVKAIGTGEFAERVDLVTFNADLVKEYRATFDDLAKELGQRKPPKTSVELNWAEILDTEDSSLLNDLEALPDGTPGQKQTESGDTESDSVPSGS